MNPSLAGSVVANLLKNAFVHGDEGGEVTVRVAPRRFTVCNSGAGGPLDAGRIFDRFYQNEEGGFYGAGPCRGRRSLPSLRVEGVLFL